MQTVAKPDPLTDPVTFADELESALLTRYPMFDSTPEWIAFSKARHGFLTAHPEFEGARPGHPFVVMDEAATGAALAAFSKGIRLGAAIEYLRRSSVEPTTLCTACAGAGVDRRGEQCRACRGRGAVPAHLGA